VKFPRITDPYQYWHTCQNIWKSSIRKTKRLFYDKHIAELASTRILQ